MKEKPDQAQRLAKWLDLHIGLYFSSQVYREKETLGQFLTHSLRSLLAEDLGKWIAGN